jgi:hypothetical protein
MHSSSIKHAGIALLLVFQASSGLAAAPYWLPEAQKITLETANASIIQSAAFPKPATASAWKTRWTTQAPTERWNEEASLLIVKYRLNPLRSVRVLTLLHVAMHDAVLRAEKLGLKQTAQSAAAHRAASRMLAHFFPLESPGRIEALGESALAALGAGQAKQAREIALGASIGNGAARLAMLRALNDGADEVWDARTRPAAKPGGWRGTPPLDTAHPQEPLAGAWQTWALKSGDEIQPPAPPAYDSDTFLRAAKEVWEVSRNLTPEQKRIAASWHLDQGTITPPGLWNRKARELAERRKLPEKSRLRLLSALNVAMMDASIACWQTKYAWWVQRPVTTIQAHLDKAWLPILVTPPHPSYVSGHATVSGAAAEILKSYFPKDVRQIEGWAEEAALSRLYGGIHYRFDNEAGLALGRQIGKVVLERALGNASSQ